MRVLVAAALLLTVLTGTVITDKYRRIVSYNGEILLRCSLKSDAVKAFLKNDYIDIWKITPDGEVDVRVPQTEFMAARMGKECSKLADVETLVQMAENQTFTNEAKQAEWFEEYHEYEDIVVWYRGLAGSSDIVTYIPSIGQSLEEREQPAVHITGNNGDEKKKIYFQCQIHAREWISGATCMYIANYLAENYNSDERVKRILDAVEIIFVPFANPDGYSYSWTGDRLWRKNRRMNSGSTCRGVDLNRNYDDHWNEGGSSGNPCSETYHGTGPASEPETQNTANYFKSLGNIVGAIDWHSYSQLILRPYGWTSEDSPDEARLKALGDEMRDRIREVHGTLYTSQKSIGLYPTTGSADDWFYSDNANVNNRYRAAGYTFELRDTGRYGFLLPPDQIIPQGEEMIPAVLLFAESLSNNPLEK